MGFKKNIVKKTQGKLKEILIGRDFQPIDRLIFHISNKKSSGWVVGNKLRNFFYSKKKGVSYEKIILIGCFPRSGSTLLRNLLDQHPKIISGKAEINLFQDIKTPSKIFNAFGINEKIVKKLGDGSEDLIEFSKKLFDEIKESSKEKILIKQPKHVLFIKNIFKHYPNARFIHIIRDGRDATMSQRYYLLPKNKKEWPYEWCCRQWVAFIKRGIKFRGDPRYVEVRYEDLVKKPYGVLKKLTDFLDLEEIPKKKINGAHKNFDLSKRPDHKNVGKPLNKKNVNKWLHKMSEKDKKIFKRIAGKTLIKLGYEKNDKW